MSLMYLMYSKIAINNIKWLYNKVLQKKTNSIKRKVISCLFY